MATLDLHLGGQATDTDGLLVTLKVGLDGPFSPDGLKVVVVKNRLGKYSLHTKADFWAVL